MTFNGHTSINGQRILVIRSAEHRSDGMLRTLHQVVIMSGAPGREGAVKGYVLQEQLDGETNEDAPLRLTELHLVPKEEIFASEGRQAVLRRELPEPFRTLVAIEEVPFTPERYNLVDKPLP